ncbi:hypothetical protein MG293_004444 [Ovis ammon polii]|uniref:Syndecan/Neurexin domain-containing protein n=1 Tax=Ovis ammon polii TaxID=230172 RepID=A0AAD4UDK3_OVIAM|nr:hypothetical protein MG293_004444 [Ovis ammon polii]
MKPGPLPHAGAAHPLMPGARRLLLPPLLLLLLLLVKHATGAQRWRSENFERPVDLEDSGNDDSFPDDELDNFYSGSGSGYFEQQSGIETAMRFSPDVALAMSTTPAVLPTMDIQPVGTPFAELSLLAAQLSQKSILERKKVLVAVIMGWVVSALFAAFLVILLIYGMKKDEGTYTLEEPNQASVKQEEFYA